MGLRLRQIFSGKAIVFDLVFHNIWHFLSSQRLGLKEMDCAALLRKLHVIVSTLDACCEVS